MSVVELQDKSAIPNLAVAPTLSIFDFYADWCGPCKQLGPFLHDEVANANGKVTLYKANVDTLDIADVTIGNKKTTVMSLPTLIFTKDGVVLDVVVGANRVAIKQNIEKYM